MRRRFGRRAWRERGSQVVEGALIAPVFFALLFGLIEGSSLMLARASIDDSAAASARLGTVMANDPDADYQVLRQLVATLPSGASGLHYAIVYRASSLLDKAPPAACIADAESGGSGVAGCNVYLRSVVLAPNPAAFGYDPVIAPAATADQHWPALTRRSTYSGTGSDLFGLYVVTNFSGVTGVISTHRYVSNVVLPLEARVV